MMKTIDEVGSEDESPNTPMTTTIRVPLTKKSKSDLTPYTPLECIGEEGNETV